MKSKHPLVSVCYCLKNGEEYLWYSMKSIYDYCDEIIIADDMSNDMSLEIIKSFPQDKIILIRKNFDRNKKAQRNTYLEHAKGTWLHIIDDDEVYSKSSLEWLRKFIQSPKAVGLNEIFFKIIWFWKDGQHVIHGHHWDQHFETFFRNLKGLRYNVHHHVDFQGQPLCKRGPVFVTDKVNIYHYSHCKPENKIREKLKYYMLRDNPNVTAANVNKYVNMHPYFSGNFNHPRFGPGGLQVAGTVGDIRDKVVEYTGEHPEVMRGSNIMKGKGSMEEYKKSMNLYMTKEWQFNNHLLYPRHTARIRLTSEFCVGRTVEIGAADGTGTKIMMDWRAKDIPEKVTFEGVEPTDFGFAQAVKKHPNIKFTKAMGEDLPFKDGEFDTILLAEVIEHVLNPEIFLKECARICRSGGRIIVTTPSQVHDDPDHKRVLPPVSLSKLMMPYLKKPPNIYGLDVEGNRCVDMRKLYFQIAVGVKR